LDSFATHVDKQVKLFVYAEDCQPINPDPLQITIYDAKQALPELTAFKDKWKDEPKANGICPFPEKRPRDHHKKFKWDAVRFANKVYAVFEGVKKEADWCVWIDADTYVHSAWSHDELSELLPDDKWITYVGRGKGSQTWPECGFYGLNLNNPTANTFLEIFQSHYVYANEGIFKLDEWHDSYIFGVILNKLLEINSNVLDYSKDMYLKEAKTGGGGHPLINTKLGKWIDHMKGDRKQLGKSKASDIVVSRKEDYWN
jgi:hypothetical protein